MVTSARLRKFLAVRLLSRETCLTAFLMLFVGDVACRDISSSISRRASPVLLLRVLCVRHALEVTATMLATVVRRVLRCFPMPDVSIVLPRSATRERVVSQEPDAENLPPLPRLPLDLTIHHSLNLFLTILTGGRERRSQGRYRCYGDPKQVP